MKRVVQGYSKKLEIQEVGREDKKVNAQIELCESENKVQNKLD